MREKLEAALNAHSLTLQAVDPPEAHGGEWFSFLTVFKTRGFLRALASWDEDEFQFFLHFAQPSFSESQGESLTTALEERFTGTWRSFAYDGAFAIVGRIGLDAPLEILVASLVQLSESIEVEGSLQSALVSTDAKPSPEPTSESTPVAPAEKEAKEAPEVASAFESIGDEAPTPPAPAAMSTESDIEAFVHADHLEVKAKPHPGATNIWSSVRRLLRGMLDVDLELVETRHDFLQFKVIPVALGGPKLTPEELKPRVLELLKTSSDSPLKAEDFLQLTSDSEVTEPSKTGSSGPATGVVFDLRRPDEALKRGDFEDPRLREPESQAALVDVVLRHPGYSDRRVGQVLSILLSIEYHVALQLMSNSPCVIATGVARDRGDTLKRMVENAGGRVLLTDPGRFPTT